MIQGDDVGRNWPSGSPELKKEGKRQVAWLGKGALKERNKVRKEGDGKPVWTHCP